MNAFRILARMVEHAQTKLMGILVSAHLGLQAQYAPITSMIASPIPARMEASVLTALMNSIALACKVLEARPALSTLMTAVLTHVKMVACASMV